MKVEILPEPEHPGMGLWNYVATVDGDHYYRLVIGRSSLEGATDYSWYQRTHWGCVKAGDNRFSGTTDDIPPNVMALLEGIVALTS